MGDDLRRRAPHYLSDWKDGFHSKVLSSTLFMFFTSIAPAITFSAEMSSNTEIDGVAQLGAVEVIMSTAITGCIFAIFSGQPLCIVGVTGPVTIFTLAVFTLADAMNINFIAFYCWVQLWSGAMHMALAITGACTLIKQVTRYSCETFGMLIATIYIVTGVTNLITYFYDLELAAALLSLVLGLGTTWLALFLSGARSWSIFTTQVRVYLADYGTTVAVIFFCLVPYMGGNYDLTPEGAGNSTAATIETLAVPSSFGTSSGRGWLVNPLDCDTWAIFAAIIPGFILTVLFFFDHNVSSLLCQAPEFGLKKGSAYHWDFFIIGIQILVTGILGIPPVNGLIPQAPLHTDSLCDKKWVTNANGKKSEVVIGCHEQRVSNLMQAVLIGCMLSYVKGLGFMPIAALDGLFIYMGIASFGGNTFYSRIMLFFTDRTRLEERSLDFVGKIPSGVIHKFTLLQVAILACIFGITRAPYVAALFPILIAVLVPMRTYLLPKLFGVENVDMMDAEGTAPEADTLPTAGGVAKEPTPKANQVSAQA